MSVWLKWVLFVDFVLFDKYNFLLNFPNECIALIISGEYKYLCPGGSGFRPNEDTLLLEGRFRR